MHRCFVIQPFDHGKFDRRFDDIFSPAIQAAQLEPYRVDHDPGAAIPVDEIERGIGGAAICFCDITEDNPNVWFELGYAIALKKALCLVCSSERQGGYPFDVQHRHVIKYDVEFKSDFERLQERITDRLKAIQKTDDFLTSASTHEPLKEVHGLSVLETAVLCTIMEIRFGPSDFISFGNLNNEMSRRGYNGLAVNLGLEKLLSKKFIEPVEISNSQDDYTGYKITSAGMDWLMSNEHRLTLSRASSPAEEKDDIPF